MPGLMIHLMTAKKIKTQASILLMTGSIAPDAVSDWQKKEITHYRTALNREKKIESIANNSDSGDDFTQGMILHLFTDWRWDALVIKAFIDNFGEGWFPRYRKELNLAGSYAFHANNWSTDLWNSMEMQGENSYGFIDGATNEDLKNLITRNYKWHKENNIGPSFIISPEFISTFIEIVAVDYQNWRSSIAKANCQENRNEENRINGNENAKIENIKLINCKKEFWTANYDFYNRKTKNKSYNKSKCKTAYEINEGTRIEIIDDNFDRENEEQSEKIRIFYIELQKEMIFLEKSCGAVICRRKNDTIEFLLLFQKKSQTWSFPKGHVNLDETEKETALREINEEIGLKANLIENFRMSITYPITNGRNKEVVLFLALADEKFTLPEKEIEKYEWAQEERAGEMLYHEHYKEILREAKVVANKSIKSI